MPGGGAPQVPGGGIPGCGAPTQDSSSISLLESASILPEPFAPVAPLDKVDLGPELP